MNWYLKVLKNYATFRGRARRAEFWYFLLFHLLLIVAAVAVDGLLGADFESEEVGVVTALYVLALALPTIAVQVRRLHDTGRSGWWYLLYFIPLFGPIALLYFMIQDGQPGPNQFGPDPKGGTV